MTVNDIINLSVSDINNMNLSELKKVTTILNSAGNKRLRRMEKAEVKSPAQESVKRSGGDFSVKGKNLNETRAEFIRVRNFLTAKTGTIKGARALEKNVKTRLGIDENKKDDEDVMNTFWKNYNKVIEVYPTILFKSKTISSDQVQRMVYNMTEEGKSLEEILKAVETRFIKKYEEEEMEFNNEFGEFFEI